MDLNSKPTKIYVFHPSPYMVDEIDTLLLRLAPHLPYENIIVPHILDEALASGITSGLLAQVKKIISEIPPVPESLILCSCSTIGSCAEKMQEYTPHKIIRIDRPMANMAVKSGSVIGLAAVLESAVIPTSNLLLEVAASEGCAISIKEIICRKAWIRRQANDMQGYIHAIVEEVAKSAAGLDVIVLAQGSMAPAAQKLKSLGIPILSSPELAIKHLLDECFGGSQSHQKENL